MQVDWHRGALDQSKLHKLEAGARPAAYHVLPCLAFYQPCPDLSCLLRPPAGLPSPWAHADHDDSTRTCLNYRGKISHGVSGAAAVRGSGAGHAGTGRLGGGGSQPAASSSSHTQAVVAERRRWCLDVFTRRLGWHNGASERGHAADLAADQATRGPCEGTRHPPVHQPVPPTEGPPGGLPQVGRRGKWASGNAHHPAAAVCACCLFVCT